MLRRLLIAPVFVLLAAPAFAQRGPDGPDRTLDAAERKAVIDGVLAEVNKSYVFPDLAKKMETAVRERQAKGEYDAVTSGRQFAKLLTDHLREVCKDRHLSVDFFPQKMQMSAGGPSAEYMKRMKDRAALRNYGFSKVEVLDGSVGLLELNGFAPAEMAGEAAAAAMNFVGNTQSLVIDLRKNGGGDPAMVILLCSYFFDKQVHLNDIYDRPGDSTRQYWSHPHVAGKKYLDKDVYILTSKRTFSAAEEFSYNMQSQKRATLIGETTGGGAHPTSGHRVTDHFGVGVPFARSINPVTKTNWEGTGVKPDVAVPAELALKTAHVAALKKSLEKSAGDADAAAMLKRTIETVQKEHDELKAKTSGGK